MGKIVTTLARAMLVPLVLPLFAIAVQADDASKAATVKPVEKAAPAQKVVKAKKTDTAAKSSTDTTTAKPAKKPKKARMPA